MYDIFVQGNKSSVRQDRVLHLHLLLQSAFSDLGGPFSALA